MKEEQMWADLIRDMPKGQPQAGDEGLDRTHTWGRTYWGGALFCFDADVEIRSRTQNKKGLQDALRGILDAGGNITQDWELTKALKVGDQATGTTVLTDLYNQMKDHPVSVNLQEKWKQLGIEWDGSAVHLRDNAPEAAIRRAIVGVASSPAATPTSSVAQPKAVLAGRKSSQSVVGLRPANIYFLRVILASERRMEPSIVPLESPATPVYSPSWGRPAT
jgi:hypothetical protein